MTQHLYTYVRPVRPRDIQSICDCLNNDGVIAMPLDVAWSFICRADSPKALNKIQRLKPMRPKEQPFSLLCSSISMGANLANIDNLVYPWLKKALPGEFTVLLERRASLPKLIHDKRRIVGLRVPKCELAIEVVAAMNAPLAASTIPSKGNAQTKELMSEQIKFGWQVADLYGHEVDIVVDLGEESRATETTIIDMTSGTPQLVRKGAGDPGLFGIMD